MRLIIWGGGGLMERVSEIIYDPSYLVWYKKKRQILRGEGGREATAAMVRSIVYNKSGLES